MAGKEEDFYAGLRSSSPVRSSGGDSPEVIPAGKACLFASYE